MTIHFYTFSNKQGGSSRQRAFRISDELRLRGLSTVIHTPPVVDIARTPWPGKFGLIAEILCSLPSIQKDDIVFLQRAIYSKYFFVIMVVFLSLFRRKMIFDIDDPLYLHSFTKTKVFTQMAHAVIACTHGEAEWVKTYNKNVTCIHIALSMSDYEKFTKSYETESSPVTIGWIGTGPEHVRNLELLVPVLQRLAAKNIPAFKFVLIGALANRNVYALFESIPGLNVEFIDTLEWTNPESAPREIQKFDIGVLPHRSEGEWNKAKTSFKILEYMACGVATIVSSFGEMPYIIEDGVHGLVAASEDEWVEKLEFLISDRTLRARLGRAGQERVRDAYSFDATIPQYIEVIESVSEGRRLINPIP